MVSTAGNRGSSVLGGWSRPPQGRGLYWMEGMELGRKQPPAWQSGSDMSGAGPGGKRTAVQAGSLHTLGMADSVTQAATEE